MATTSSIHRPQRWDQPFGDMSDEHVEEVLATEPFSRIDPSNFPAHLPLRDILRNDARIVGYNDGDIVVRLGDYSNSAFFVLFGTVRVVLETMPVGLLGRAQREKRGFFGALSQLWKNPRLPEARELTASAGGDTRLGERRSEGNEVRIFLQDPSAIVAKYQTAEISLGESFGEIAALARTPRTATVFAQGSCGLLEIRWQGLRDIRSRSPEIREFIDQRYREHSLLAHLRETEIFAHLDDKVLQQVAALTEFETYGSFNWHTSYKSLANLSSSQRLSQEPIISHEGDYPNGVALVRGGFARVSQRYGNGHKTLKYIGKGQMYGFEESCHNFRHEDQIPLQYSLRALGYVDVLVVPTKVLEQYVLPSLPARLLPPDPPFPHLKTDSDSMLESYKEKLKLVAGSANDDLETTDLLEKLVEGRFINGTTTMMINLDRCTRCDDCIRGCAAAHNNNPRFIRHGPRISHFMVANACMHCADPVCMIGCPTGAIHRNPKGGQVIINDDSCIGCGTCANSCPYENIRMVEIRDKTGTFLTDQQTRQPILKATKCDLCFDQVTGPACQNACPHDALRRVDMHDLDGVLGWMQR